MLARSLRQRSQGGNHGSARRRAEGPGGGGAPWLTCRSSSAGRSCGGSSRGSSPSGSRSASRARVLLTRLRGPPAGGHRRRRLHRRARRSRAGAANTLRLGDKLHVGVVVAELAEAPAAPLSPGLQLQLQRRASRRSSRPGPRRRRSARPRRALTVRPPTSGRRACCATRRSAAGRTRRSATTTGELPGFALPPPTLTDLRILHGSLPPAGVHLPGRRRGQEELRRPRLGRRPDPRVAARHRRRRRRSTPNVRPHQLFLTGDQIYADDVVAAMLPMLNRLGNELIGGARAAADALPAEGRRREPGGATSARPKQPGFATLAGVRRRPQGEAAAGSARRSSRATARVRVLAGPLLRPRASGSSTAAPTASTRSSRSTPTRRACAAGRPTCATSPPALRGPVIECEAQFSSERRRATT